MISLQDLHSPCEEVLGEAKALRLTSKGSAVGGIMNTSIDQGKIMEKGREIFRLMEAEPPAVFDKRRWVGELMDLAMRDPALKVQLFRFIDVFPALTTSEMVAQHLKEYFPADEAHL